MIDRLRGWLKTLDSSLPFQQRSRSASRIIDRRTRPEDVEAIRFAPLADQPHHEVSPFHPSREGRPESPVEDTTGSLTTHSHVNRRFGSPVPTIDKATARQQLYTSEVLDATSGNTSRLTASNGAIADGTTNILTAKGLKKPEVNPEVPYALTWTEHDLREALKSDDSMGDVNYRVLPRFEHSCTAIPNSDGEFIIFGGTVQDGDKDPRTNDVFLLSTTDMSLTSLETNGIKPEARMRHGAVIAGRVLVVFGGHTNDSHLHFLNLDTREWSKLRPPAPFPGPRYGQSFILVDNTIWLFGGDLRETTMDDMWCINFGSDDIKYVQWRQLPKKEPWPDARSYHSTVHYGGSLYLFAGECTDREGVQTVKNDVWKFEIRAETWTKISCHGLLPEPRSAAGVTLIGGNMITFGGWTPLKARDAGFRRSDQAYVLNLQDQTWRSLALLGHSPPPTAGEVLLTLGSRLVVVGGYLDKRLRIYMAETRVVGSARDSLAQLQFTAKASQLKFTTEVVDLSRFIRKQGDAAHALAGFSDVWKGEITETGKPIAIKVLRVASVGNPDDPQSVRLRKRFDRELTIWMECQHPRVLELLGYAYIEGIPCLISPWCENGNIMEHLKKNPNENRLQMVIQVAEGLVYLHGRDPPVIHSDVKPANVLINESGDAKICDFGISKLMMDTPSGFTTTKSANFTLRYSAKELLCAGKNSMMSDVFAFGMLALEVMTNRYPFFKISLEPMIVMAIMNDETPSPEDYPEVPVADPLWNIMKECWGAEPENRPTMAVVLDKLRESARTEQP